MGNVKVGIIGCNGIADTKHIPSLLKLQELSQITALCDTNADRARQLASKYTIKDVKIYDNYKQLLDDKEVEAVHICTPNTTHREIAVAAFSAGKHVLCEKPMAHTAKDAKQMLKAWANSGKKFTIGYQNRFSREAQMLKECCMSGELGEIYFARAFAVRRRAVPTWGAFLNKEKQGGGPLIDIGTHALDLALWFMENYEPISVSGAAFCKLGKLPQSVEGNIFGKWDSSNYTVEDSAFGFIRMKNSALVTLDASWALNVTDSREASCTLCGTKAGAELKAGISYPEPELIFNRAHAGLLVEERPSKSGNAAYFSAETCDPGVLEAKQWLNAIIEDTEPLVKPEQALIVTQILEAVYRSSSAGCEVLIDD